jgi:hypothetical protein
MQSTNVTNQIELAESLLDLVKSGAESLVITTDNDVRILVTFKVLPAEELSKMKEKS